MMVMTTKVDIKKVTIALAAVAGVILAVILLFGGGNDASPTVAPTLSANDGRVQFLKDFGWEVSSSPAQSGQVRIPEESSEIFDRYNALQKSQGYDLSQYAGKTVMRYVYKVNNYPGATDPVYATLLIHKDQVIGGDVTNTAATGVVQGFRMPNANQTEATTQPSESTAAAEKT